MTRTDTANGILLELEAGIGRFSTMTVSKEVRRIATALLNGTADSRALWTRFARYEQQGLVQGGPVQPRTASADKRFLARALRLMQ